MREGRRPNMLGVLVSCVVLAMLPVDLFSQGKPAATTAPATTPQVTTSTTDQTAQSAPEKPVYVSPFHATGPVARVDGEPITAETFNEDAHAWAQGIRGMLPTGQLNLYRDQLLEHAIDRHLFDRAMKKAAIELSDEELEEQWQAWLVREFPSPLARELFLKDPESDLAGLREELALQWRRQRFIVKRYKIEVTKAELAKFYASYGEGYTKPELVHARQILLSLPQDASVAEVKKREAEATLLRERLVNGDATFAELARQHSEDPSAVRDGDIGWLKRRRMMEDFSKVAFALEVGEISQPVRTFQGWHIIEVVERSDERKPPLEEIEPRLRGALFEREVREATNRFLVSERRRSRIERMRENIQLREAKEWQFDWSTTPLEQ